MTDLIVFHYYYCYETIVTAILRKGRREGNMPSEATAACIFLVHGRSVPHAVFRQLVNYHTMV